jgi:MarR family
LLIISTTEEIVQESLDMATRPSADPPVSEFAGQLFFRLWRATHTRTAEVLGSVGLTPALFALLNVVGAREGAIQQELGSALGIDRSTMVSLIDQLESAGLARRRPSATDRRPGRLNHAQRPAAPAAGSTPDF